jgi:hypothetical protein
VGGTLVCSVAVSVKMNVLLLAPPLLLLLLKVSNAKMSLCWTSDCFISTYRCPQYFQFELNFFAVSSIMMCRVFCV